jgi:uncharacterized protein (TIGR02996 family)
VVTTEDDFQRAIDARVDDWNTRLVFADWLDERADPRAEGYRALGQLRLCPFVDAGSFWWTTLEVSCCGRSGLRGNGCSLPKDWFKLMKISPSDENFKPLGNPGKTGTRRYIEDAAAVAFGKLSAQRQTEILATLFVPEEKPARRMKARAKPAAAPKKTQPAGPKKAPAKPVARAKKAPPKKGK